MLVDKSDNRGASINKGLQGFYSHPHDRVDMAFVLVNRDYNITYYNKKVEDITGLSREGIKGRSIFDILFSESLKEYILSSFEIRDRAPGEYVVTFSDTIMSGEGKLKSIKWHGSAIYNEEGSINDIVFLGTDETDKETYEKPWPIIKEAVYDNLKNSPCGIAVIDANSFKLLHANRQFLKIINKADIEGKTVDEVFTGTKAQEALRHIKESIRDSVPIHGENEEKSSNRLIYDLVPMLDNHDNITKILMVIFKSAYKPVLRELIDNSLFEAFDTIRDGIVLCDPDGRIIKANNGFLRLFQLKNEVIEGKYIYDTLRPLGLSSITGRKSGKNQFPVLKAIKAGKQVTGSTFTFYNDESQKKLIDISAFPVMDDKGSVANVLGIFHDSTLKDAVSTISRLIQSAGNMDDLIEESIEAIMGSLELKAVWFYTFDDNDHELKLRILKGKFENTCPLPVRDSLDIESPCPLTRAFVNGKALLIKNYRQYAPIRHFDPLARKREIRSAIFVPVYVSERFIGELVAVTGPEKALSDIDSLEISKLSSLMAIGIEKFLSRKDLAGAKEKAELFLDLLCHDINNVSQTALSMLEMASRIAFNDEDDKKLILKPLEAVKKTIGIIDSVRSLQKIESGNIDMSPVDLHEVISECVKSLKPVEDKKVSISYRGRKGCYVYASSLLKDVFDNIIDNAIRHTGIEVNINASIEDVFIDERRFYRVSIEDDGIGIPGDIKEKVFQRFPPGSKKAKGKGIGLFIVRYFTEKFGGKAWVEDRIFGDHTRGSRFIVMLPAFLRDGFSLNNQ